MTTVVLILMILVCFNFLLKQTFVTRNILAITTLVLGIFAAFMWQVAIEQSKTQIIDWLHDTALMRNIAAILSIDVVVQLTFCIFTVRSAGSRGNTLRSRIIVKGLLFYPGFIIFPVVFALLVQLIFLTPGVSFTLVSTSLGVAILFAVPLGRMALRTILPESDLRLEILFLSNVLVALVGIVATVNGETQNAPVNTVDIASLIGFVFLLFIGGVIGFMWNRWQEKMFNKKEYNK